MTQRDYQRYTKQRRKDRDSLSSSKGKAYADQGDRFENFKARAELLGLTPELLILADASKHFHRLVRFARGFDFDTDGVHSRADDMIIYTELFDGLIAEKEGQHD